MIKVIYKMVNIMDKPIYSWVFFFFIVVTLLVLDLGVFHKKDRTISIKESIHMTLFYITIACLFGLWIFYLKGIEGFLEYMTGFLVEKSLSVDNIFLITLIFSTFSIPKKYQYRVLFWGIIGVIILRAVMIYLGSHIITRMHWVLYLFAALMILNGIKMIFMPHKTVSIEDNILLKWLRKHLNITKELHGQKFFISKKDQISRNNKIFVTPLFVALVMIEAVDLVFAVDSIPAIFAITQDNYIIYTSNIFAILGLRSLYFAISSVIDRFYYLKYSLAIVLIFIGSKIFISDALDLAKIPPILSLVITMSVLSLGIIYSMIKSRANKL